MKKILPLIICVVAALFAGSAYAQVSIGGKPTSFNFEKSALPEVIPFVQTPPLDMATIETEDATWEMERAAGMTKIGRRFGIEVIVDYDLHNSGVWSCLPNGGKLWRLGVECPEALSINFIFDQYRLPDGAMLYIYSQDQRDMIGGFTSYNNQADHYFATDVVFSDKVVIEYYQPADAAFDGELHLWNIVHGYRGPGEFLTKEFSESGYCQINVVCPTGQGWEDQIRSVFCFTSGGYEICSGSMINNTANDGKAYALTANHCWNAATNPGIWVLRFNWQSPVCTPSTNVAYQTMTGATLKSKRSETDFCLVELNQPVPAEYNIYYSGWSRSATPSASGMCIHHPAIDIKKISPCNAMSISSHGGYTNNTWMTPWSTGACTEGGSSGSPIYDSNKRIVGQLWGGASYCGASPSQMNDKYGRFDLSWNGDGSVSSRLKDWLDPLNSDVETLDGYDPNVDLVVDAELHEITAPVDTYYYIAPITPAVVIKNSGTKALTSAVIAYKIDAGAAVNKTWTGNLKNGESETVTLDPVSLTSYGQFTFAATITADEDINPENNSKTKTFEIKNCKTSSLSEGFETGTLPDCWQNAPVSGTSEWTFVGAGNNGTGNPAEPKSGSYNARFSGSAQGNVARLITPPLQLTSMPDGTLYFWHAQAKNGNNQDKLRVYYKNAENGAWTLLSEFIEDTPEWKEEYIVLPEKSEIYYIAFEGISDQGSGVLLDMVTLDANLPSCESVSEVTATQSGEDQVILNWTNSGSFEVGYRIFRGEQEIANVDADVLTYIVQGVMYGNRTFCVMALYDFDWCAESEKVCTDINVVGINELPKNDVQVYPNPANTQISIEGKGIKAIELYNIQGQLIANMKDISQSSYKISVADYPSGIYIIKIQTENGQITKRINVIR